MIGLLGLVEVPRVWFSVGMSSWGVVEGGKDGEIWVKRRDDVGLWCWSDGVGVTSERRAFPR
jgi:hypothetical protein